MKSWRRHRRHFFILSSAGKPIYSRYGNEQMMSTFMGIIQALISFIADEGDTLRTVVAHRHKFVFLLKGHIYLVAVTRVFDSENQLREQLNYLNALEKLNCAYCAYANGVFAYVREVGSRTEQYWCPIKHARRVLGVHARYGSFVDYGDGDAYRHELEQLRAEARSAGPT